MNFIPTTAMEPIPFPLVPATPAADRAREEEGRFIDDYLPHLMARAAHVICQEFQQELRRRGVSVPVWRVLAALVGSAAGETVTGLAETCLLQQPTMTKLLDRMARDGLILRSQDGRDRRIVRVVLSPRGEAKAMELVRAARQHEQSVLARAPEAEAAVLKSLLRSIMARHAKPGRRSLGRVA